MGEMLWSAVCRGALLDRRWWPSWMRAVQTAADFRPGQVSVDMEPDDDTPNQPRRWFADPVTRLLIAHWHRDRMRLTCPATPEECLRAYLPQRAAAVKDLSQAALNRARATWRLRLPGVLFAYASGEVPSVSLPKATWRRLTRGVPMPDDPRASRPPGRHPVVRNDMDRERTILAASARSSNLTGRARDRARKVAAIAALKNLPPARSRLHTGLRRWCIFALESENGRSSIGYVPSTVFGYLKRLLAVFDGWPDRDPTEAASYELVELFVSRLEQAGDEDTTVTMKAMGSFARFYNLGREDEDELELDLDSYRTEHPVSANLISPRSYQRALASLTDGDGPEAAIVLMLAYRTGARLPEIMGLQVGDFIYGDRRLELVIQENEGRALKTKTSRRILPLDVLLDDDERAQLEAWLDQRRPVARAIGDSYVFGPIGAAAPPPDGMMRHRIEAALRKACGSDQISIPHLRHSFASCLLATLLLPQDVADPLVPEELAAVVSRQRFVRVVDRFLGQGRLGGGAVHAVSQAMGHTGPATTLRSYCHLLDLCLGLYVSRPSSFVPVPAGCVNGGAKKGQRGGVKAGQSRRALTI